MNQQDNLSTGIREPSDYVSSRPQSLNEPATNYAEYIGQQDDNFANYDFLEGYNEFPHIDSNYSMDGMRQQSVQNVNPYLTLGARPDIEASSSAIEVRDEEALAPVQPEELGDVTKRDLQLIKHRKKGKGKGKAKSSSNTNRVAKEQAGPRKKSQTLGGSCWRCRDQKKRVSDFLVIYRVISNTVLVCTKP